MCNYLYVPYIYISLHCYHLANKTIKKRGREKQFTLIVRVLASVKKLDLLACLSHASQNIDHNTVWYFN